MKTSVAIVKCGSYNPEEVQPAVRKVFNLLCGGIDNFIKKGEKVLLKPNILSARPSEDGVCTHREIIRAMVRLIKEARAIPLIGDNPGGSLSPHMAYEGSGLAGIAIEEDVELKYAKGVKIVRGIPIASYFFECDKIISLPKMKTHSLMGITAGVKNMYGAVQGLYKSECHKRFPSPMEFAGILVDVYESVRPHLCLMDGVIAMEGNGPSTGILRRPALLIAGHDSVAVDAVFSHLIGIEPFDIVSTKEAYRRRLGEAEIKNIEIKGEKVEDSFIKNFKMPDSRIIMALPGPLLKKIAGLVKFRPYINERICEKCMICAKSCPISIITIDARKSIIDSKKCIRCMCCHEVCPYRAVELRRNILAKLFGL